MIVSAEGKDREEEGCLSIPDAYGEVTRAERIVVEALDRDGKPFRREFSGLLARAIQHEIDPPPGLSADCTKGLQRKRLDLTFLIAR